MLGWSLAVLGIFLGGPYVIYLLGYQLLNPTECPADKEFVTEDVTVVLPTYNEASLIKSKLSELATVSYPTPHLEVLVVDSSTDETAEVATSFAENTDSLQVRVLKEPERRGVATAVNLGVKSATGDIIFRTDCDSQIGDDTITHAVAGLQDAEIGGVMGHQSRVIGDSKVESEYRSLQARNQALESAIDSTFIVHGPCFAFRREDYDPIRADSLADDTEVGVSLRRQGKRVVLDPEMKFAESGVSGMGGRRKRKDRRAMGLLQVLLRSRDMLGRYGSYGRLILPFNWWFLLIAPWITLGIVVLSIISGFLWFDFGGIVVPLALTVFVTLGQRDSLGPIQPLYAVFDSNLSLVLAAIRSITEENDGLWEMDTDSRTQFER